MAWWPDRRIGHSQAFGAASSAGSIRRIGPTAVPNQPKRGNGHDRKRRNALHFSALRYSHWSARLRLAEGRAGVGEPAEQGGGSPAFAVALVPGGDLAVNLGDADAVGPVHQPAAVAREAEAVQPHHVDVAGAVGLALFEDLAGFVDRGEQEAVEDLLVGEALLRDPELGRFFLDHAGDF